MKPRAMREGMLKQRARRVISRRTGAVAVAVLVVAVVVGAGVQAGFSGCG